jgi:hypothetical protein
MRNFGLVAAILLVLSALPANAGLIGQPVTVDYIFPDQSSVFQVLGSGTVTAGGFTANSAGQFNLTITDTQITLQNVFGSQVNFTPAAFNGFELIETGGSPVTITGFTVNGGSNVSGFDASRVSFDATHVFVNMQDLLALDQQKVVLDLQFPATSGVPEPLCAGMVGFGLAAVGLVRRFKR